MHKLWRGIPSAGPVLWTLGRLDRNPRAPMPASLLRPPPLPATPLTTRSRCTMGGGIRPARSWPSLLHQARLRPSSAWLRETDGRRFIAVESSRSREKGGSSDVSNEKNEVAEEQAGEVGSSRVVERRQKGSGGSGGTLAGSVELLAIPGVGPRNLRKLVDKGFRGIAQLKQLYRDEFFGKSSQKMVEFLQSSIGIIHKNHAESIMSFIRESVDEESKEKNHQSEAKPAQKKRLTFCIEGNISVGKTTFLQRIANETLELRDLVEIVPEPINKWQDVGPDHFNILDAFYAEPQRYAYTFQNYVFVTRVMQERESAGGIKPLRLMERSVFSDRMVFVRAVHEAK